MISMLWGNNDNMAYFVRLSGKDLSGYSNKIELSLRKRPYYHYLTKKVILV